MRTYFAKDSDLQTQWKVIDAEGQILGRVASAAAALLMGKDNVLYSPNHAMGCNVLILNADKVKVTGKKLDQKFYYHYSGYPGGMKSKSLKTVMESKPEDAVRAAVKGMLPKNKLQAVMMRRVRIYSGTDHPHEAQAPTPVAL